MGWKKLILGEKMPDKNDPQYRARYEREVSAGRKFARWTRLDKVAACVQRFALRNPKWFLGIVFAIVLGCLAINLSRMAAVYNRQQCEAAPTATQQQEKLLIDKKLINNGLNETETD